MTEQREAPGDPPLCVDLDGTLIEGDALRSGLRVLARSRPWLLAGAALALLAGRPALKRFVAERAPFDPTRCRWCDAVLAFLREERKHGRTLILATAADAAVAHAVARHLGIFDAVLASDRGRNLKGAAKRDAIRNLLRSNEFDYIGDSRADVPIFAAAQGSYLVEPSARLLATTRRVGRVKGVLRRH